jgi:molecular chaperone GrpE
MIMFKKRPTAIKLGIYKHYKNHKEYEVLFSGLNTETKEELVVYQELGGEKKIWLRPKDIFLAEVEIDGQKMPRFEFITEVNNEDKEKFEDKYKRALADYQNLLKQTAKEKHEFAKYANEELIHSILPVYDNLKMALEHSNEENQDAWLAGVKHVVRQFKDVLENNGVQEIETVNKKFDHNIMEAVDNEETDDDAQDGLVAKELKTGYKLNGKVIVPARVVVYKYKD